MTTPSVPQPRQYISLPDRVRSLATILLEEFGVPFRFFSPDDGSDLWSLDPQTNATEPARVDPTWLVRFGAAEQTSVTVVPGEGYRLAISFHEEGRPAIIAVGRKTSVARPHPDAIREETSRMNCPAVRPFRSATTR